MTNAEQNKALKLLTQIEAAKDKISRQRDYLRGKLYDLESILDSVDESVEKIGDGLESLRRGVESVSKYL